MIVSWVVGDVSCSREDSGQTLGMRIRIKLAGHAAISRENFQRKT